MTDDPMIADDLAIAAALHVPEADDLDVDLDLDLLAEYEEVLAALPIQSIEPPADLEARTIAAALALRPAAATSIASARSRRSERRQTREQLSVPTPLRRRFAVVAAAAVIAVAITAVGVRLGSQSGDGDVGLVSTVNREAVAAAEAASDSRSFELTGTDGTASGNAVVTVDGTGYVYELTLPEAASGRTYYLWLSTPTGAAPVGDIGNGPAGAEFVVAGPYDGIFITLEDDGALPASPGAVVADSGS